MERISNVTIRVTQEIKTIKIGSDLKPEIIDSVIQKWQFLIDTLAKIIHVPSGLIMRLNENTIEVFLSSRTTGNPYKVGEKAELIHGLYCETVIGTQKLLVVPDATKSKIWGKNNPDVDINMISYLGVPINWPDGECFGTVCVLDNKENHYSKEYIDLVTKIKHHIETDLQLMMTNQQLKELNITKTKFLSLISHDIRGNIGSADAFLKLILENFKDFDKSQLNDMLLTLSQSLSWVSLSMDNLLSWSKEELLQIEPEIISVDVIKIINELLQYFKQSIQIKELNIKKDFYSSKAIISADKNMITVSLRNILSNAIKYTPNGGLITIRVTRLEKKHIIEIIDTGVGMNKKSLSKIFSYDKTHQKSGTQGESSSGIGLLLTKEFFDKNKAVVNVESKINKGTKFSISI